MFDTRTMKDKKDIQHVYMCVSESKDRQKQVTTFPIVWAHAYLYRSIHMSYDVAEDHVVTEVNVQ